MGNAQKGTLEFAQVPASIHALADAVADVQLPEPGSETGAGNAEQLTAALNTAPLADMVATANFLCATANPEVCTSYRERALTSSSIIPFSLTVSIPRSLGRLAYDLHRQQTHARTHTRAHTHARAHTHRTLL